MGLTQARYNNVVTVPRKAWDPTEKRHRSQGSRPVNLITGVEVHWAGSGGDLLDHLDTKKELLGFERYHEKTKGWTDLFYNVAIDSEGNVYEGRHVSVQSQKSLRRWLTVLCVAGTDRKLTPAEEQTFAIAIRDIWTAVDGKRSAKTLRCHSDRKRTACPGPQLRGVVARLKSGWDPAAELAAYFAELEAEKKKAAIRPAPAPVASQAPAPTATVPAINYDLLADRVIARLATAEFRITAK